MTLEKAIEIGRNHEANLTSLKKLAKDEDPSVNSISQGKFRQQVPRSRRFSGKRPKGYREREKPDENIESKDMCGRCGLDKSHQRCPAIGQQCRKCLKMNHYAKVCRAKPVHKVQLEGTEDTCSEDSGDDSFFVYSIGSTSKTKDEQFYEIVEVENTKVKFQLDSGAKVNVMSFKTYSNLKCKPLCPLKKTSTVLISFSKHKVKPCGEVLLKIKYKDKLEYVTFFVVEAEVESVLSGNTCVKLGLLKRVYQIVHREASLKKVELEDYPEMFKGLGCLPGRCHIQLKEGANPVVHPPRKVPIAQKEKVVEELRRMESLGVIVRQEEATDWVNSLVVVQKPNGSVRLCIDPRDLNDVIKRSHHPMKTVDEVASRLAGANTFSILDAKSGFWQLQLDEESSLLCTFNTPIGRYRFKRLPFGVKCAPEIFQRTMDRMVEDLEGVEVIMDDVVIAGDETTHDERLHNFMERASTQGLKLNREKCKIRQKEVPYVGHLLTAEGLKMDPKKVEAIQAMPKPNSKEDVKRFLGFVQFLSRYLPDLSTVDAPLRELEKADVLFHWDQPQQTSFEKIKQLVLQAPVLQYYDVTKPVIIQCDASGKGLGAVLLQEGKPVCYASRALTDTESRYAAIEAEMLAVVFACRKFHQYIYGRSVVVESDHKPLQAISSKPLSQVPLRLQKMVLDVRGYDVEIRYVPGSKQVLADTLSRASLPVTEQEIYEEFQEIHMVLAVSEERYEEFQKGTKTDSELQAVLSLVKNGWPDTRQQIPAEARPYWTFRDELVTADGLLFKGTRLVVPTVLRAEMLRQIHKSHLGIVKCRQRAREALFWPGMSVHIGEMVTNCSVCANYAKKQPSEPLKPTVPPKFPWEKIGTDLFEFRGEHYLVSVCYRSKFPEVTKMESIRSGAVVQELKRQFGVHGIPAEVISDNGPQYTSREFQEFRKEYGFKHTTSSPHFPKANGEVERVIQTVKNLWRKNDDKYLALLDYRTTPLTDIELSPAQLLMGRRLRNDLPMMESLLQPANGSQESVLKYLKKSKEDQKKYHDQHASKELEELQPGTKVR